MTVTKTRGDYERKKKIGIVHLIQDSTKDLVFSQQTSYEQWNIIWDFVMEWKSNSLPKSDQTDELQQTWSVSTDRNDYKSCPPEKRVYMKSILFNMICQLAHACTTYQFLKTLTTRNIEFRNTFLNKEQI